MTEIKSVDKSKLKEVKIRQSRIDEVNSQTINIYEPKTFTKKKTSSKGKK